MSLIISTNSDEIERKMPDIGGDRKRGRYDSGRAGGKSATPGSPGLTPGKQPLADVIVLVKIVTKVEMSADRISVCCKSPKKEKFKHD